MTDRGLQARWWERPAYQVAIALMLAGVATFAAGVLGDRNAGSDVGNGWGFLAGFGVAGFFVGLVKLWIEHQIDLAGIEGGGARKRERMQAQRASMLWAMPIVTVLMLGLALEPAGDVLAGETVGRGYFWLSMPVLYAWFITATTMGWDVYSRKNRRFLDDELTRALRMRALTPAFTVLMAGVTIALVLGLVRPLLGIVALPFVLAAAAATAGIRFAWLEREAGKDG
ncbi:MAG: hypothetical protein Q8S03_03210 [Brevundimonas sp.]|uniref:hypothetical protein n=1 Tax=Brevundimonas sp. TaxID=1871086 RepID=UPI002732E4A6|nr:hypothetical protein [Brevundimonas sp.]MDP3403672.1 hypothetical protein [Brevundimonas sp.]